MAKTKVVNPEVKTYTTGGKGKRQCPECKQFVSTANQACACGYTWPPSNKAKANRKAKIHAITSDPIGALTALAACGGVEAVRKQLDGVAKIEAALEVLGGIAGATAAIELAETLEAALGKK